VSLKRQVSRLAKPRKIVRAGRAYYVALPAYLIREGMLERGVILRVLRVNEKSIVVELRVYEGNRKYGEDNRAGGKDA